MMSEVIKIAMADKETIEYGGKTHRVNDSFKTLCKKILRLYQLCIAIMVVIGINVAQLLGSQSFIGDMIMVLILLALLHLIFNIVSKRAFKRVFGA